MLSKQSDVMCHKRVCICIKFSAVLASCFASFSPPPVALKTGHLPCLLFSSSFPLICFPSFHFYTANNNVSICPINGGRDHELTICSRYKVAENWRYTNSWPWKYYAFTYFELLLNGITAILSYKSAKYLYEMERLDRVKAQQAETIEFIEVGSPPSGFGTIELRSDGIGNRLHEASCWYRLPLKGLLRQNLKLAAELDEKTLDLDTMKMSCRATQRELNMIQSKLHGIVSFLVHITRLIRVFRCFFLLSHHLFITHRFSPPLLFVRFSLSCFLANFGGDLAQK